MTSTMIAVDREAVESSFREWQAEQALLDEQLAESVAALDAYQSHLDAWQQELAREREELRQLRGALARELSDTGVPLELPGSSEQSQTELVEARDKITSLTAALLARTEELRDLDQQRGSTNSELALARSREKELAAALTAHQENVEAQRQQWETEISQLRGEMKKLTERTPAGIDAHRSEPGKNCQAKVRSLAASPVLGSVMEQFGKLRQQRSINRPNPSKPR